MDTPDLRISVARGLQPPRGASAQAKACALHLGETGACGGSDSEGGARTVMIEGEIRGAPGEGNERHTGDREGVHGDQVRMRNRPVGCDTKRDQRIGVVTADVSLAGHASRGAGRLRLVAGLSRHGPRRLCTRTHRAQDLARCRRNRDSSDNRCQNERAQTREHHGQYTPLNPVVTVERGEV